MILHSMSSFPFLNVVVRRDHELSHQIRKIFFSFVLDDALAFQEKIRIYSSRKRNKNKQTNKKKESYNRGIVCLKDAIFLLVSHHKYMEYHCYYSSLSHSGHTCGAPAIVFSSTLSMPLLEPHTKLPVDHLRVMFWLLM